VTLKVLLRHKKSLKSDKKRNLRKVISTIARSESTLKGKKGNNRSK
jgi:hypothetical protein